MRTTVASLVPVRSARPVTVRAAQAAGSAATASATRCTECVMDGARVRTLAVSGSGTAPPSASPPGVKVSFRSSVTCETYFPHWWPSTPQVRMAV